MPRVKINDFRGGVNKNEPTTLKNNQFEKLSNFIYDGSKRVRTRLGYKKFGPAIGSSPVTSLFFHQRDDGDGKILVAHSGSKAYKYDEVDNEWDEIDSGLTEFEPSDTSKRTRWDFAPYKNILYGCNGVDDYRSITIPGGVVATYAGQPKIRYIEYMGDRIFGAGDDENPITLYYTGAQPANAETINTNVLVIGGDETGRINGLREVGQVILAGKSFKIFSVDVANTTSLPIDSQNGWYSNRVISSVGNGLVYYNPRGVDTLKQRNGVSGAAALETSLLSEDLEPIFNDILVRNYNSHAGIYLINSNNYYISLDTNGDDRPNQTLIYSSVTSAWTECSFPVLYDYSRYIDNDGNIKYLFASGTTGQVYEFDTGLSDDGGIIIYELLTKRFDFEEPAVWKDFDGIDIVGLASEGCEINVDILIDGEVVQSETISDDNIDVTRVGQPIGLNPVGLNPIGGGGASDLLIYPYLKRIPLLGAGGGTNIQVRMQSNKASVQWTLDQMTLTYENNAYDLLSYDNF